MKIHVKSLTPATLTVNSLGNYIIRGGEEALNIDVSGTQLSEFKVLEREGLIKITYDDPEDGETSVTKRKGRGRPKGSKNKTTIEKESEEKAKEEADVEAQAEAEEKAKADEENKKVTRNKTEAEAVTDEMGGKVVVSVPGGPVEGKMVNSSIGEAQESLKAEASIEAMKKLEEEEKEEGELFETYNPIKEEDLDPSEQMGGKAVISVAGDSKKVDLVNSVLPEADVIKERDPFIDKEDNAKIEKVKDDLQESFLESLEDKDADDDTFIEV